jgi:2-C-methyl-D-erythritol 2,4-cyclodiphosphate synthase
MTGDDGLPFRVGAGYDIHRFGARRPLMLGGVHIPYDSGLIGHSDADVVLHAVIDALLGAAGLGDIGTHFPPGDPRYQDADSGVLLRQTAAALRRAACEPVNVDVTVIAERPRIAPHAEAMRRVIAGALGVPPEQVSVKAKSNEGLDAVGRGEAVAAWAVALVRRRRPNGADSGPHTLL